MVKKMMATVQKQKDQQSSPKEKVIYKRRQSLIFAESLFEKRFGLPTKEGNRHCFLDLIQPRAATEESPRSDMEEKKIFKNENFNQTSNRHAGTSRNFKNETEEHMPTK